MENSIFYIFEIVKIKIFLNFVKEIWDFEHKIKEEVSVDVRTLVDIFKVTKNIDFLVKRNKEENRIFRQENFKVVGIIIDV